MQLAPALNIRDAVEEYESALMENAQLASQENSLKVHRIKARKRLNDAKDTLRAMEADMQFLLESKAN